MKNTVKLEGIHETAYLRQVYFEGQVTLGTPSFPTSSM